MFNPFSPYLEEKTIGFDFQLPHVRVNSGGSWLYAGKSAGFWVASLLWLPTQGAPQAEKVIQVSVIVQRV